MKTGMAALIGAILLGACTGTSTPPPALPEGAPTQAFAHTGESFLRGVRGSSQTVPRGRPSAILSVDYTLSCLADNAATRRAQSVAALDAAYVVSPLFLINPRERGAWRRDASRTTVGFGCVVTDLQYSTRTNDPLETGLFAIRNNVPPV